MAVFKNAIEVSIPDLSIEELKVITKSHDTDEIMATLGYVKKEVNKVEKETKYMISLPMQFADDSGYPSNRLAIYENGIIGVVQQDEAEAWDSSEDWGFTLLFDEETKDKMQRKFNGSLIVE